MKKNLPDFLRKCQYPLLIASIVMPILLIFTTLAARNHLYLAWSFAGVYVLMSICGMLVPGKRRLLYGVFCCVVLILGGYLLLNWLGCGGAMPVPVVLAVLLLLSLRFAGWSWADEIPEFSYWAGLAFHVGTQILLFLAVDWKSEPLLAISNHTIVAFFIFIVLAFLSMTRGSMIVASMGRHRASANMRRKNTAMIMGFFGVVLLLALLCSPAALVVVQWIKSLIAYIKSLMPQKGPTESIPTDTTVPEATGNENELLNSEPSPFFQWLQALFMTIFDFVLMIALPLLLIGMVGLFAFLLFKLIRYLLSKLTKYANAAGEDYDDVITDTRDNGQKESLGQRLKNSEIFVNENKLSPEERVRLRYRRLLRKHPQWTKSSTARENLPEVASPIYEQARYSGKSLTKEDADRFASDTKDI